jgi:predicted O-methyltransferase YrrM
VSAPTVEALITIEGSPGLSAIARRTIAQFSERCEVRTALFDDALTELASELPFDLAFIDGQHEGAATLHYDQRVRPLMRRDGGIVVFDDIYWSHDMFAAWKAIVASGDYALTIDLGSVGVAVLGTTPARHVDLMAHVGRPHIPRRVGDSR